MISRTAVNRRQYEVQDTDAALYYYKAALHEDCRISAFGVNQTNPELIFIELDASSFSDMRSFKAGLTKTLKNIEKKIGGHPTVIWSGRGYHIIQPIWCPEPLENIKNGQLTKLEPNPSNKFLQFAERYLSLGKSDSSHNPAIKSCLLRVPGSKNSKCKDMGLDPEVKIIQKWNGHRPHYKLLFGRFYADLVGKKNAQYVERSNSYSNQVRPISLTKGGQIIIPSQFIYIEKILLLQEQKPLDDYRKLVVGLILSRYLINIKGLNYEQAHKIIWNWLDKCAQLRRLEPSRSYFDRCVVKHQLNEAKNSGRLPMTLSTMKAKYPELYETLTVGGEANE
jgi:hypothetical protein